MAGLYNFIYRQLVEAGTSRDASVADDALKVLEYQRETWVLLIDKLREERAGQGASSPPPQEEVLAEASYGTLSVEG